MAPMTRSMSPGGVPTKDVIDYYQRRAKANVGLIITEGIEISHPASSAYPNVPRLDSEGEALRRCSAVFPQIPRLHQPILRGGDDVPPVLARGKRDVSKRARLRKYRFRGIVTRSRIDHENIAVSRKRKLVSIRFRPVAFAARRLLFHLLTIAANITIVIASCSSKRANPFRVLVVVKTRRRSSARHHRDDAPVAVWIKFTRRVPLCTQLPSSSSFFSLFSFIFAYFVLDDIFLFFVSLFWVSFSSAKDGNVPFCGTRGDQ